MTIWQSVAEAIVPCEQKRPTTMSIGRLAARRGGGRDHLKSPQGATSFAGLKSARSTTEPRTEVLTDLQHKRGVREFGEASLNIDSPSGTEASAGC